MRSRAFLAQIHGKIRLIPSLNAEIIKQGYGFAYTRFPFKYMDEFRRYEREAREQGEGLWGKSK